MGTTVGCVFKKQGSKAIISFNLTVKMPKYWYFCIGIIFFLVSDYYKDGNTTYVW